MRIVDRQQAIHSSFFVNSFEARLQPVLVFHACICTISTIDLRFIRNICRMDHTVFGSP